jgi:hypothetical protein
MAISSPAGANETTFRRGDAMLFSLLTAKKAQDAQGVWPE